MLSTIVFINVLATFGITFYIYEHIKKKRKVDKVIFIEFSRLINQQIENVKFMNRVKRQGNLNAELQEDLKKNVAYAKSTISSFTAAINTIKKVAREG